MPIEDIDSVSKDTGLTKAEKKARKKKMLIAIIIVAVLGCGAYYLLENQDIFDKAEQAVTNMYSDKLVSYIFYPADYSLDVTTDTEYMGLDRQIYYKTGAETMALSKDDSYSNGVMFFMEYFDTIIKGDYETYNTYFTDNYYKTNNKYVSFAPQMLYDIKVEQLSDEPKSDGTRKYTFNVSYKIHRNNGTFRNDIDSDASKKLYYELIEDKEGNVKIDRITYYVRG